MIDFYNNELERFNLAYPTLDTNQRKLLINDFINTNSQYISWSVSPKLDLAQNRKHEFKENNLVCSLYRPFFKQYLYFDRDFNERVLQMPRIFPNIGADNLVIQVTGVGARTFSTLISNALPCYDNVEKGQCFPLYLYDEKPEEQAGNDLFTDQNTADKPERRDAITDAGLGHFQEAYPGENITKEDVFFYVYGLLHSEDYRTRFADNLSKELPRIPRVKTATDFWAFSKAGRDLANLHLNYETVEKYPLTLVYKGHLTDDDYRVQKMKFGRKQDPETGKNINDRSTVIYNNRITLTGIPDEAWDYVVNGKAALDWVMERQAVTTHKDSGIVNDANDWAIETMKNPKYPLELFQRVITVSLETQKIVNNLPELTFMEK